MVSTMTLVLSILNYYKVFKYLGLGSMRNKSLVLLLAFMSTSSWALPATNPQMRACRMANGQFFVLDTGLDKIGLCRLGPSIVGAIDLLNKDADTEDAPNSVVDYRNGVTECDPKKVANFPNPIGGRNLRICYYDDGSIIDMLTLNRGKNNPLNSSLNKALGLN